MATARPLDRPRAWDSPSYSAPNPAITENEHENQPLDIKIGKMIFYATAASNVLAKESFTESMTS